MPADSQKQTAMDNLREAERSIKQATRNPSSYETISAVFSRKTGSVCLQYRAENGFGGMSIEHAVVPKTGSIIVDAGPAKIAKACGEAPERIY